MQIGIYGGTFDPVHLAHLVLAEQCLEQLPLDEVWFVPAAIPPHKTHVPITPANDRCAMLEYALAGHAQFRLETIELERQGPSYTVDTLEALTRLHPDHRWSLLLGADSVREFETWRTPERILELAQIVAVNRGGDPPIDLEAFQSRFGVVPREVEIPSLNISASDLRRRVAAGRSVRFLVPRAVEVYIAERGLYRA